MSIPDFVKILKVKRYSKNTIESYAPTVRDMLSRTNAFGLVVRAFYIFFKCSKGGQHVLTSSLRARLFETISPEQGGSFDIFRKVHCLV
ncbi:hypothetical protein QQ008_05625 [Fulvivirgaceae bacterium BMA10]|uniref:Integrase SAM-like N-terminal domain-containing protein n=1 Tax=Splendidivirga corallicola TaxID=3051826 RepID=A0ABT8KJE9_9BACT|nr:hypothetical protein [Fulvivirgaceae bacterium BMA10]